MLRGRGGNRLSRWICCLMLSVPGVAGAATVELVSGTDVAADTFGLSIQPALSSDGRYVAFLSNAANLVPGQDDDNDTFDVFLHDRALGTTTLVSHAAGSPARAASRSGYNSLGMSADGRYVAFTSWSTDLVPGAVDGGINFDVFLWDRITGTTTLVSHAAGLPGTSAAGDSTEVRISADGNYLAFLSSASNLVPGQAEPTPNARTRDVFLWSRVTDTLTLVSRKGGTPATVANRPSLALDLSADGGVVVFTTLATDLLPGVDDINSDAEVYAYQRSTDTLALVSRAVNAPEFADGASHEFVAVSADGRWVAFASLSGNMIAGQLDGSPEIADAFLYDRTTGEMRLVSRRNDTPLLGGGIFDPSSLAMSADGRYVAFSSPATDLVPQVDTNQTLDVFVYDRVSGLVSLASHRHDSVTTAGSLGATNSASPSGKPSFSADGRFLAFQSPAVDLVSGQTDTPDTLDVFLYDTASRNVALVSRTPISAAGTTAGNARSLLPVLSADGSVTAFLSQANDLGEGQTDPYNFLDLFLYHRASGEITTPSRRDPDLTPPRTSLYPSNFGGVSADGQSVVFDREGEVFVRDTATDTTVSLSPPLPSPGPARAFSKDPALSADGRFAAFLSNLPGTGTAKRLYLYDRAAGTYILVNHAPGQATEADGNVDNFALSADGRFVAYQCGGCSLVAGHPSLMNFPEIFLYDRLSGLNTLVSHPAGASAARPDGESYSPAISADGRFVAFWSFDSNLSPGQLDVPKTQDLFVYDRETGENALVTHLPGSPTTATGTFAITSPLTPVDMSADGRFIAFKSILPNLVSGQVDISVGALSSDVFLYDRVSRTTALVSHAASSALAAGNGSSAATSELEQETISMSADGRFVVYDSLATDLAGADVNFSRDVFLYDRLTGTNSLVSHAAGARQQTADETSELPRISADGSRISFLSTASDLTPVQTPAAGWYYLYVQNREEAGNTGGNAGARALVGRAFLVPPLSYPLPDTVGNEPRSYAPQFSADGRRLAFNSEARHVPGDYNATWDVYLWDQGGPVELPPCRLLDTRRRAERPILTSNLQRIFLVHGACGVPATAKRVVVQVTAFNPSGKGNLRFYPGAATANPSAILRFERGTTRTETFTLPVGPNGTLTILPFVAGRGTVHGVVEVNGYTE